MSNHLPSASSRSDFAALQDMRFAQPRPRQADPRIGREEVPLGELSFRQLRTKAEIAQVRHLRREIQLPAAALADPSFSAREKKETSRGLSARSSAAASSSGPFASFR